MAEGVAGGGPALPSIQERAGLADVGASRLADAERAQWDAAYGKHHGRDAFNRGILSSDAETGFAICARHGAHCKTVNPKTGKWDRNGICEWCYREDFDPVRIQRRRQEVADRVASEERALADRLEMEQREDDPRGPMDGPGEGSPGAHGEGSPSPESARSPAGWGPPDAATPGADGPADVAGPDHARGPALGPDAAEGDPFEAWLERTGVEPRRP